MHVGIKRSLHFRPAWLYPKSEIRSRRPIFASDSCKLLLPARRKEAQQRVSRHKVNYHGTNLRAYYFPDRPK